MLSRHGLLLVALAAALPGAGCRGCQGRDGAAGRRGRVSAPDLVPFPPAASPVTQHTPAPGPASSLRIPGRPASRAASGFGAQGREFVAWGDTYSARVARAGGLSFTPRGVQREPVKGRAGWTERDRSGIPLTLGPGLMERGGRALPLAPGRAVLAAAGALERRIGFILERLEPRQGGLRRSWTITRTPPGQGALTLRMKVSGLPHRAATPGGLHFMATEDGLGVRLGGARWVTSSRERSLLGAFYSAGELRLVVPARLLKQGPYPAYIELLITPELGMDRPVYGPADANQEEVAMASDGDGYLVVWRDGRARTRNDIYAARVSAGGQVLDPEGILLRRGEASCDRPAVVWGQGHYLVVWEEHRGETGFDIVGARLTGAGTVLDPAGIVISPAPDSQVWPTVAFDGQRFWVAWEDRRGGQRFDIYAARVTAAGEVLDPRGLHVSAAEGHQKYPAICADRRGVVVAWSDLRAKRSSDIYAARLDAAGEVLDPAGIRVAAGPTNLGFAAVQCRAGGALVVWEDDMGGGADLRGAVVARTGEVLPGGGGIVAGGPDAQEGVALARRPGGYLAVWQDRRSGGLADIHMSLLGVAGGGVKARDPAGKVISAALGRQERPDIAAGKDGHLAVWLDRRHGTSFDVYGRLISAVGEPRGEGAFPISSAAGVLARGALAADGERALAAWRGYHGDGHGDILLARPEPPGAEAGGEAGKAVSVWPAPGAQDQAALAAGDGVFLLVWRDRRANPRGGIVGLRIDAATGKPKDETPIKIGSGMRPVGPPSVAHDGQRFLAAWSSGGAVRAARVGAGGKVLDAAGLVVTGAGARGASPRVAGAGGRFLVVWQDGRRESAGDIRAARVDGATGGVLAPAGIAVSAASGPQTSPAVCAAGEQFWVAWQDERPGTLGMDIHGARVRSSDGVVLDPESLPLRAAPGDQQAPALAFDGQRTLAAWQDLSGGRGVIHGTLLEGDGAAPYPGGLVLGGAAGSELAPVLVSTGPWRFVLGHHTAGGRLGLRIIVWGKPGAKCEAPSQCRSGRCLSGACAP